MADFLPGGGSGNTSTAPTAPSGGGGGMAAFLPGGGNSSSAPAGKVAFNSWANLPVGSPQRVAMQKAYISQNTVAPATENFATKVLSGIGGAVVHAPAGAIRFAADTGKAIGKSVADVVTHPLGIGETKASQGTLLNDFAATPSGQAVVAGAKQTANEVRHPTQIARNYSRDPVGSLLNDVANIAPIAHGLGAVAEGAEATSRVGAAAKATGKVLDKVATAPIAGPVKLPKAIGDVAYGKVMSAAENGATKGVGTGAISRNLARLGDTHNALSTANLEGAAHETQTRQAVNRVQMKVAKILPDKDEQAAWVAHIQGESPAYHLLQTHMPDQFERFVTEHTGGTMTPRAAQLAADVASGKNPELADRMEKATEAFDQGLGGSGLGSLARMSEEYTNAPGREWQAEGQFAPNPVEMQRVSDLSARKITAALKGASKARQQATEDRMMADAVREARYGKAAGAAEAAQSRLRAAQGYPTGGPESNELPATTPAPAIRPGSPVRQAILGERANRAEAGAVQQGRLAHPDYVVGTAEDRARASDAAASKAESKLVSTQEAARRLQDYTASKLQNAPSRLRPVLSTNRAVASEAMHTVNELHAQGLHEQARQLLDALDTLPQSVKELEAAQRDARYVPHTQEGRPGANAFSAKNKQAMVSPRQPGALKNQREGSQSYDRSVGGVAKGIVDRAVYDTRVRTAEKIANLPFAARLNEGPLAGIGTKAEAQARGYEPWQPGALFDKAGNVRSLGDYEKELGITGDTVFIPRPLIDSFRNYFEPHRGELLRAISAPGNKAFVMTRLAFSPALITGRLVGHTVLSMVHEGHNPVTTYRTIAEAYRQFKASGDKGERNFAFLGPDAQRVVKGGTMEAEVDRMKADQEEAQRRASGQANEPLTMFGRQLPGAAEKAVRGLSKLNVGMNAAAGHTLHAAAFWDNLNRSAYYMIEKNKGASDADAVRAALRATGEFDRMTPFERDYARTLVPFWAWHREITRIAAHLAEDEPVKVAWLMHLGNLDNQQNGMLEPQFDQGSISVGGNEWLNPGFLFPFTEAGNPFQGGLGGIGKDLGPLPRVLVGQTGINPTSGKQWYEPPGTPTRFGMPMGPGILKQLGGLVPEVGVAGQLTGANKIDRYANGEPVLTKAGHYQPQPTGQSLGQALSNFAGVSLANRDAEIQKQAEASQTGARNAKTAAKTLKNYLTRKARVFGGASSSGPKKPSGGGMADFLP